MLLRFVLCWRMCVCAYRACHVQGGGAHGEVGGVVTEKYRKCKGGKLKKVERERERERDSRTMTKGIWPPLNLFTVNNSSAAAAPVALKLQNQFTSSQAHS